ncbi:MAG: hypothetical protein QOG43_168 [Actinomycetota bacterium]|nr:hypothetical protein [Actinomycetota bacterium]
MSRAALGDVDENRGVHQGNGGAAAGLVLGLADGFRVVASRLLLPSARPVHRRSETAGQLGGIEHRTVAPVLGTVPTQAGRLRVAPAVDPVEPAHRHRRLVMSDDLGLPGAAAGGRQSHSVQGLLLSPTALPPASDPADE